jgi:hypothetical protein
MTVDPFLYPNRQQNLGSYAFEELVAAIAMHLHAKAAL